MLLVSTVKLKYFTGVPINKNSDTLAITDFHILKKKFNVMNLKVFGENASSTTKKLKKKKKDKY